MSAHTPGPWEVNPSGVSEDGDLLFVLWPHTAVIKNRHNRIADVKGEANTRLIAASPDLYEALESVIAFLGSVTWNDRTSEEDAGNLLEEARIATAKA